MQNVQKETRPVIYNAGATKILRFKHSAGRRCFQLHWHERFEMLHIKQGQLEYTSGHTSGIVSEGQVLIIPPNTVHYGKALTDCVYDVLMFDVRNFYNATDVCKNVLSAIFDGSAEFDTIVTDGEIRKALDSLCFDIPPDSLLAIGKIYELLHLFSQKGYVRIHDRPKDEDIREIVEYIEQNFDTELSTASLSEQFGYTAAHFSRKFKKATGLSPMAYIRIFRLEKACNMIIHSQGQISEIAAACGFTDPNYFTRCFKAHYKHPPSYYKNEKGRML